MSERLPGTPPRSVVTVAFLLLFGATGAALWLLPGPVPVAGAAQAVRGAVAINAATELTGMEHTRRLVVQPPRPGPSGLLLFARTATRPKFDPVAATRRSGARWVLLGHLNATGPSGCQPRWGGVRDLDDDPVARRLGALRAAGGHAAPAFGGHSGRELAAACADRAGLIAAYRRVIDALDATHLDFEIAGPDDPRVAAYRADVLGELRREAAERGRTLTVSFSLPLSPGGLSTADRRLLAATGDAVDTVNLLAPLRPSADGRHLRELASAIRQARAQIVEALALPAGDDGWGHIALTTTLSRTADLSAADARTLAGYAERRNLAWLSFRGARPGPGVTRALARPTR
ncbi:hypothetical protein [Spongiactinospora sp. TRM90649]|uniref:hypothetical protein n=1 Tax=Spongiactinospora sp. TRM90649 TaxID=3031114 RepID=UPI0023F7728D|nr:hypothetical protein [Spongiactinospora sp. TRM90649]MDF5757936.1 hypothetical protein [Spongiactinospora sp. TRM90649]